MHVHLASLPQQAVDALSPWVCCLSWAARCACLLQVLEGGLARAGVPYSYGFAIILLTVMVKAATYPLTKKSVSQHTLC
jgi:membrane protein insertase Oxa1/YidC/SpoIIIJ